MVKCSINLSNFEYFTISIRETSHFILFFFIGFDIPSQMIEVLLKLFIFGHFKFEMVT